MIFGLSLCEFDSEVSKTEGRVGQTTNMVLGGTVTDDSTDEWLTLDQKVDPTTYLFLILQLHSVVYIY